MYAKLIELRIEQRLTDNAQIGLTLNPNLLAQFGPIHTRTNSISANIPKSRRKCALPSDITASIQTQQTLPTEEVVAGVILGTEMAMVLLRMMKLAAAVVKDRLPPLLPRVRDLQRSAGSLES